MKILITDRTGFVPKLALKRLAEAGRELQYRKENNTPPLCKGDASDDDAQPMSDDDWVIDGSLVYSGQGNDRITMPLPIALQHLLNDPWGAQNHETSR